MNHVSRFHKYWLIPLTIILMFGVLGSDCDSRSDGTHSVTAPAVPAGAGTGHTGENLDYATGGSSCSREHPVEYRFDWGDGNLSTWGGGARSYIYGVEGTYSIKAQARCATKTSIESGWSAGKSVAIEESTTGTMTGNDGKTYQTVKIGSQWWMAENLKETKYRTGDAVPEVTDNSTWSGLSTGARCAYDNSESTANTYGYLYNWYTVDDSRNLAPSGWRVPTDDDWKQLEMFLGMSQSEADNTGWRGTDEGGKLKEEGTSHWSSPNTGATNESGFTALPGGYRSHYDGYFDDLDCDAYFWSATEYGTYVAWARILNYNLSGVFRDYGYEQGGFSVRLVRD